MRARVVIVGAGVAGTMVANRVAKSGAARVTVMNGYADHQNQPAYLYLPLGRKIRMEAPARDLLLPQVEFKVAKVGGVRVDRRTIVAENGETMPYDFLVIATGSRLAHRAVPGLDEASHNFHCHYAAWQLKRALERFSGGRIVVGAARLPYKCPPSAHEFALLLDEHLRKRGLRGRSQLTFVYPAPALYGMEPVARMLRPIFEERGISIETSFETAFVERGSVAAADGREVKFDLLVMVPPHTTSPFLRASGLTNRDGWVPVDSSTLKHSDRVYALGDAAALSVPKSGAAAHYQAKVVAANVLDEIAGRPPSARYDGHAT